MAIGAILSVGASILGGVLAKKGAKKAAKHQSAAAAAAQAQQLKYYEQGRRDLAPYRNIGKSATLSLAQLYGLGMPGNQGGEAFSGPALEDFRRSPDYQFSLGETKRQLDAELAGIGQRGGRPGAMSGRYGEELVNRTHGLASTNIQNYISRLSDLANLGRGAATTSASLGQNAGSNLGQLALAGGQARAAGVVGETNAITSSIGNIANNLSFYGAMNNNPSAYGPTTSGWAPTVTYGA